MALLRGRLLSFGMILGIGFLLLVSLVLSAGLAALAQFWDTWFEGWEVALQAVNFVVSFAIITGLFAMIYKLLPRCRIEWKDVWVGAMVTSLLFALGKLLIGLYLGKSGVTSGFGAAGSLVIVLVWVYYSSQIFLLGAEFTKTYAHSHGSLIGQRKPGAPLQPAPRGTAGSSGANQSAAIPKPAPNADRDAQPQYARADDDWLGGFNRFRLLAGLAAAIGLSSRGDRLRGPSAAAVTQQTTPAFLKPHPVPGSRWMLSTHGTFSGLGSTFGSSRLTTTGSWPLRQSTQDNGSLSLALISWCGTNGGT